MEGGLLLDVVVRKGTPVFKLFASEDEALLVWGNAVWYVSLLPLFCCCRVETSEILKRCDYKISTSF